MKLPKAKANVINVNNRKEMHGEVSVLAVVVKMEVKGAPELLDAFDTRLRASFFETAQGKDHIPRFAEIEGFTWGRVFEDATIELNGVSYSKVKLKGFAFTCREGGVVAVTFTASWNPAADIVGTLAELIKEAVDVEFVTQFDMLEAAA